MKQTDAQGDTALRCAQRNLQSKKPPYEDFKAIVKQLSVAMGVEIPQLK